MRIGAALLLLSASGVQLFGQGQQVGFVLAAEGGWKWASNGNPQVKAGDLVAAQVTARALGQVAAQKARLTVALLDGSVKAFECPPLNPCVAAFGALRPPTDSLAARLLTVSKTFFSEREAMPVYAISRGASQGQFQHAVLILTDGQLELGPAIVHLDPGVFAIRLRPLQGNHTASGSSLTWDPPTSMAAIVSAVEPGAYEMIVNSSEGARIGSVPVIVSTPAAAPAQRAALEEGRRMTSAWPRETDPAAVYNYLTALLMDIAKH